MIAASPPVIWFQSPSPWIGPSAISKFALPVSSLVAPTKPLKNPPVSNEATASPVGPNGQKLSSTQQEPTQIEPLGAQPSQEGNQHKSITAIIKARANVAMVPVMWVRVPGACAPILMVSSLGTLRKAPNKPMIAANPPVIWFQSPSPWIGPSAISKVELSVSSLVAPTKPLKIPPVSNEATASPVGPNGQKTSAQQEPRQIEPLGAQPSQEGSQHKSITAIIKARANVAMVPVMWVRVPGACAPVLMVSSLGTLKKAPNKPMIAASPPVIWFQSPSPWIGPSSISKVELSVSSLVAPTKPLKTPPMSTEATASPVGPNGQKTSAQQEPAQIEPLGAQQSQQGSQPHSPS